MQLPSKNHYVRNGIAIIAVIMVGFALFGKPVLNVAGIAQNPEVVRYAEENLLPMNGDLFPQLLAQSEGRPTLVFVFASWCPYCKQQFPIINALRARYDKNALHTVYVSVDKNAYDVAAFLMEEHPHLNAPLYHASGNEAQSMLMVLKEKYGLTPSGGIPYLMVFDKNQHAVQDFAGLTNVPELLNAISPLLK